MGSKGTHTIIQAEYSLSKNKENNAESQLDFKSLGAIDGGDLESLGSTKTGNSKLHQIFNAKLPIISKNQHVMSYGATVTKKSQDDGKTPESGGIFGPEVTISDVIGGFGWFQFLLLLFSGLREGSVGYEAVVMSIILQPEHQFLCAQNYEPQKLASELAKLTVQHQKASNMSNSFNETAQCFRSSSLANQSLFEIDNPMRCESWVFPHDEGVSLIAEWSLVCHRHWLVAFIESAYFLGLVSGNLLWGYLADRLGRRKAYLIAHTVALVAGWTSLVSGGNIYLFALTRFFSAFGSISYNVIYSLQVELIGSRYRAFSTTLNHLGWGIGVMSIPLVNRAFDDYRYIIGAGPMLALLMFPWAFWLPESCRWLMTQGRYIEARKELLRAARFNGKRITGETEKLISQLADKIRFDQHRKRTKDIESNPYKKDLKHRPYSMLFSNFRYTKDALILAYVSFTSHLFYYMLTINFAYIDNLSPDINFISSGASEWVSVIAGAILLRFFSRKSCMSFFLAIVAASFLFQAVVESGLAPALDQTMPVTINNAVGTLSALLTLFISLIVNQEVFPTMIRQTGASVVNTIGEVGSTISPILIQLSLIISPTSSNILYAIVCLTCSIAVVFVTKTDDIELEDT